MSRSIQLSIQEIELMTKDALLRVSPVAVRHLLRVCQNGGLDGKRYDSCIYGQLAVGEGYAFPGATASDTDHFKVLHKFCATIGVRLVEKQFNPLEAFGLPIRRGDTTENSREVEHIATWCLEVLTERPLPKYVLQHDNITQDDLTAALV